MAYVSPSIGYLVLGLFGLVMVIITYVFARWEGFRSLQGFLVAGRDVNWLLGAVSIAASWIWAPALFISVQMAYQKGLPGIFWFTFPNIIAIGVYTFLAPRIRKMLPYGFTLPQWIYHRLKSRRVHLMYLFPYFFYQLMAVSVQLFAGGSLVSLLTGIPITHVMVIMSIIVLAYSLISGLEASMVTDLIQFFMIIAGVFIVVPWAVSAAGGWRSIQAGLGGITGRFTDILDPSVALSFGIVTAIGLLSGAISDQQYWQRSFAIKEKNLAASFLFGALMFGMIPVILSLLGFIAAGPSSNIAIPSGVDVSMVGVLAVKALLPPFAMVVFVLMLLSALFSTLDSGIMAASSMYVIDVVSHTSQEERVLEKIGKREPLSPQETQAALQMDKRGVRDSRIAMFGIVIAGLLVALASSYLPSFGLKQLWWVFNTIAACVVVPTILSLYWSKLDERGVFWGVLVAFILGIPGFIYGNMIDNPVWTVGSSIFIIAVSTAFCFLMPAKSPAAKTA